MQLLRQQMLTADISLANNKINKKAPGFRLGAFALFVYAVNVYAVNVYAHFVVFNRSKSV